jgi:hypothetical protein
MRTKEGIKEMKTSEVDLTAREGAQFERKAKSSNGVHLEGAARHPEHNVIRLTTAARGAARRSWRRGKLL